MSGEQTAGAPEQATIGQAMRLAGPLPGERVLDLSGRAGSIAVQVAPAAASVEAMQPEEGLAEEGRRLARVLGQENVYFHAGPLHRLPFDGQQFDLVFWCLALSGQPLPLATLTEIGRVLRPEGRLVVQDILAFGRPELDLKIWELERRRNPAHILFYEETQVEELLTQAGLAPRRRERSLVTQNFDYWAETAETPAEVDRLKRVFFGLSPAEQDELDLALADGRISFSYPVLTLLAGKS